MNFDPCNRSLKIQKSIETPTPKVRAPLGVWRFIPSHFLTLYGVWDVNPRFPLGPLPLQTLGREPKAKVATEKFNGNRIIFKHCKHVRLIWDNTSIKINSVIRWQLQLDVTINEIFIQVVDKFKEEL
jgi:hypothetical protein